MHGLSCVCAFASQIFVFSFVVPLDVDAAYEHTYTSSRFMNIYLQVTCASGCCSCPSVVCVVSSVSVCAVINVRRLDACSLAFPQGCRSVFCRLSSFKVLALKKGNWLRSDDQDISFSIRPGETATLFLSWDEWNLGDP